MILSGIYKITNTINNKSYIGKSKNILMRIKNHIENCSNMELLNDIIKYGIENFTFQILELYRNGKLNKSEYYYIKLYDTINNGYNVYNGTVDIKINDNKKYKIKHNKTIDNDRLIMLESDNEILYFSDTNKIVDYFDLRGIKINELLEAMNFTGKFREYKISVITNDYIISKYINPEKCIQK